MSSLPILTPQLLYAFAAAACAALVAVGVLALWRIRARRVHVSIESLARQVAALRDENGAQSATLVALAAHFDALQRQLATDARFATGASGTAASSAYELAIRLARGGATVEELVAGCVMSRHEAELALRLHGPQTRTAAARLAAVR